MLEDPVGAPSYAGLDQIREFYERTHRRQGRLRVERVGPVIVRGDQATLHVRAAAESRGDQSGMDVIYVVTVDEQARITRLLAFF